MHHDALYYIRIYYERACRWSRDQELHHNNYFRFTQEIESVVWQYQNKMNPVM